MKKKRKYKYMKHTKKKVTQVDLKQLLGRRFWCLLSWVHSLNSGFRWKVCSTGSMSRFFMHEVSHYIGRYVAPVRSQCRLFSLWRWHGTHGIVEDLISLSFTYSCIKSFFLSLVTRPRNSSSLSQSALSRWCTSRLIHNAAMHGVDPISGPERSCDGV